MNNNHAEATETRYASGAELRVVGAESDGKVIHGIAAPYGDWNPVNGAYLEQFTKSSFKRSIDRSGDSIPLLVGHDHAEMPVGKPVNWTHSERGLECDWELANSKQAVELRDLINDGQLNNLSVGFIPDPKSDQIDNSGQVRKVSRVNARLLEVSLVSVGSAEGAVLTRSAGLPVMEEEEEQEQTEEGLVIPAPRRARAMTSWDELMASFEGLRG